MIADALRAAAEIYEPDDTIGLLGLLVVNGAAIIAAIGTIVLSIITVRGQRAGQDRARKIDAKTDEIHEQVVNTHDTNLRADFDELRDLVTDGFRRVERDIGGIREEIRTERKERIAGDRRRCEA
ncbi:hypothetical protein PBI_BUTTERS_29 [Mycobacterium phage Butters]|uniref:Uncharacterized protein n=1 Tax=Mycobacterium phage Butters TaxID=1296646 RepID=M4W687_9CAUD|nr:minor tail protein [Mycobacterium phage Butters]AGI12976.1 hypothetical protein PBI_BUTTERS_29 [Mycobacterium phage Butters]